uniref:ARAD1B08294p1 n=1 Tax=Blastobotrys adeninivorans TaxID=409370 RepID=A0A060T574_BLAAD
MLSPSPEISEFPLPDLYADVVEAEDSTNISVSPAQVSGEVTSPAGGATGVRVKEEDEGDHDHDHDSEDREKSMSRDSCSMSPGPGGNGGGEKKKGTKRQKEDMKLPLPPGALPPRKRAKTEDEKEQRRVERILRNRQAAHASREKKRKHVEDLERKCVTLTSENDQLQKQVAEAKQSQVQMLEQQYLLMARLQEYQSIVKAVKTSGDLSALDRLDETPAITNIPALTASSPGPSDGCQSSIASPASIKEEYASPESLVLSSFTAPSSPLSLDTPEIKVEPADESSSFLLSTSFHDQAHHPAAVVFRGLSSLLRLATSSVGL